MAPRLATQRFVIRELQQEDLEAFTRYRADPEVARFQGWSEYCYEDALELLSEIQAQPFGTPGHWFQLAIIDRQTQQLAGDLAVHFIDRAQVEVGFTVAPAFQRQGVASEALRALLAYLFDQLAKHRVVAITDAENHAAGGLLQKMGFRQEGHFIQNLFFDGRWGSEFQFAILNAEWRRRAEHHGG